MPAWWWLRSHRAGKKSGPNREATLVCSIIEKYNSLIGVYFVADMRPDADCIPVVSVSVLQIVSTHIVHASKQY